VSYRNPRATVTLHSFEGECCWGNTDQEDTHDWRQSSVTPDEEVFGANFGAIPPSDTYLITAGQGGDSNAAHFVSCAVACATGDVLVTLE